MDEANWREQYNSLKKSYEALYAARKTSIEADNRILEGRLQEHEENYERLCKLIDKHSSQLKQSIEDINEMKEQIRKTKTKINDLRIQIGTRDPILRVLVDFPIFNIRLKKAGVYYVRVDVEDEDIRFCLVKERASIMYSPVTTMPRYLPEILQKQCVLDNIKLRELAEKINIHFLKSK